MPGFSSWSGGEVGEHFDVIENGTAQVMDLRVVGFGVPEAD